MSIADHNVVPGKKFWTWGNGPSGLAEDHLLTDSDGPYIELMVGAYTDNQPDYSWLEPYETRQWTQYWYPVPRHRWGEEREHRCSGESRSEGR